MKKDKVLNLQTLFLVLIAVTLSAPMLFNNVAIILFTGYLLLNLKGCKIKPYGFLLLLPLSIYLLDILSVLNSDNTTKALQVVEKRSCLLVFAIGFFLLKKVSNKQLYLILDLFVLSLVCLVTIAFIKALILHLEVYGLDFNYQSYWLIGHHKFSELVGMHATYFSNYIIFSIAVILFGKNKPILYNKAISFCVIMYLVLGLMILSVRTSFIIFSLLLFYFVFVRYKAERKKLVVISTIAASLLILLFLNNKILKERFEDVFSIGKSAETSRFGGSRLRAYKWESAYQIFTENPILGVGNGDLQNNLNEKYKKLRQNEFDLMDYNSHNQYLNDLAAKGGIGFIILLFFISMSFWTAYRNNNNLLFVLLLITALSFFTENILTRNKGIVFTFFFFGLLCSNLYYKPKEPTYENFTNT